MLEKLLDLDFSLQTKCRILKTTGCNFTISLTTELDQPCPHLTISKWISYIQQMTGPDASFQSTIICANGYAPDITFYYGKKKKYKKYFEKKFYI